MKQELGSLLNLYLDEIEIDEVTEVPQVSEYLLVGASKAIEQAQGNNYIPVIVSQIAKNKYKVVANSFIYLAAKRANLERIWCVIVDDSQEVKKQAQIMAQELIPKINLADACYDDIRRGLDYLINRPSNNLVKVKLAVACSRIAEASKTKWKTSLIDVTKLKCGITKGKKLNIFKEVFCFAPISPLIPASTSPAIVEPKEIDSSEPISLTDPQKLKKLTVAKLKKMAKERKIPRYSKMRKADLVNALSS